MTPSTSNLDSAKPSIGKDHVTVGNGNTLPNSHIGHSFSKNLQLLDVLVVPHITKILLTISKLTKDQPVDILPSESFFAIQDHLTKNTLAQGRVDHGLYILEQGQKAFMENLSSKRLHASFEIWHSRLGRASFDVISFLAKLGHLSFTSF